jgi:hypothetical protein
MSNYCAHLLAHQCPQLVQIDDWAVVVVLLLVEVPHTNLRGCTAANKQISHVIIELLRPFPCPKTDPPFRRSLDGTCQT